MLVPEPSHSLLSIKLARESRCPQAGYRRPSSKSLTTVYSVSACSKEDLALVARKAALQHQLQSGEGPRSCLGTFVGCDKPKDLN